MESFYDFLKKQSRLELLSEQIEKGNREKAQKTLIEIVLERTFYMGIQKKNNLENEIDRPLKIYIAGPYTPNNASSHDSARIAHENTVNAINFGIDAADKGHLPYIPHLSHFVHLYGKKVLSYDYYTKADIEWLKDCDAILYYHHKIGDSKGADNELKIAIDSGKTVFFSVYDIPKYVPAKKDRH
ncbi:hypothetical protein M1558_02315 [Candidatus Parvarchaeota archaeon]|nr:hypothetical protein [Candidatus Parvarchaeota archaeon]